MQENHNRNIRLKEENLELASKLKKLVEQYERREEVSVQSTDRTVGEMRSGECAIYW